MAIDFPGSPRCYWVPRTNWNCTPRTRTRRDHRRRSIRTTSQTVTVTPQSVSEGSYNRWVTKETWCPFPTLIDWFLSSHSSPFLTGELVSLTLFSTHSDAIPRNHRIRVLKETLWRCGVLVCIQVSSKTQTGNWGSSSWYETGKRIWILWCCWKTLQTQGFPHRTGYSYE